MLVPCLSPFHESVGHPKGESAKSLPPTPSQDIDALVIETWNQGQKRQSSEPWRGRMGQKQVWNHSFSCTSVLLLGSYWNWDQSMFGTKCVICAWLSTPWGPPVTKKNKDSWCCHHLTLGSQHITSHLYWRCWSLMVCFFYLKNTCIPYSAAAAAKSLQSCLNLCDPIDGSPLGSSVPGILQARILEWVAISFSNAWKWKVKVKSLSHDRLLATPWTGAYQAPPSMGFSRQEYWSGVPLPSLPIVLGKFIDKISLFSHISITSDMQMTPPLWQKVRRN